MSARADFPPIRYGFGEIAIDARRYEDAMEELDRLRRWKAEAILVLNEWDILYEACGSPGGLGTFHAHGVLAYVRELEARLEKTRGCV